jgi:hypothetical protein
VAWAAMAAPATGSAIGDHPSDLCALAPGSINGSGCTDGTADNSREEHALFWMGPRLARPGIGVAGHPGKVRSGAVGARVAYNGLVIGGAAVP